MGEDQIEREILLLEPIEQESLAPKHHHRRHHHQEQPHFTQDLVRHVNLRNFKLVALVLVAVFFFYHSYLNSFYGRHSCNRLLGQGHIKGDNEWQPFGCMIHRYTKNDIHTCFRYIKYYSGKNSFVFIGDTRIRQVFTSFIKHFDETYKESSSNESVESKTKSTTLDVENMTNVSYSNRILNFEATFIWKPTVDESLSSLVENYLQPRIDTKPSVIVLGMTSAYLLQQQQQKNSTYFFEALEAFKSNLSNLADIVKSLHDDSKFSDANKHIYKLVDKSTRPALNTEQQHQQQLLNNNREVSIYWMLQDPIDEAKYFANKTDSQIESSICNRQIDIYNRAAINLLYYSPIKIWSSSRLVSQAYNKDSPDGFHIGPYALEIDSQILFNLYCNNRMNFNDASCCSQPEQITLLQQVVLSLFFISIFVTSILFIYKTFCKNHSILRLSISGIINYDYNSSRSVQTNVYSLGLRKGSEISLAQTCKTAASHGFYNLLITFTKISLIMLYFFACDRANYFMKENQHFTYLTFFIPLVYLSVVGIFFQESLATSKVLNRFQTDELKGFMQLVILLFRMSSAFKSIPLYLLYRLFTSAYLFLSGYGHFMYYWNTGNYGLVRFFQVLFRVNFLPILLCFTMNRMYQFYSFIPLVTFWFVASYILMLVYPHVSARTAKDNPHHYFYMLLKLILFGALITTLNMSEVLFEKIFMARPWKFLFVSSDDLITEWRQRWSIDRFAFLFGMSFALGICILKRINLIDDLENGMTGINGNGNSNGNINNNSSTMPNGGGSVGAEDDYHYQDMATSSLMNLKTSSNSSSSRFGIDKKSTNRGGQLSFKAKFVFVLLAIAGMGSYYLFAVLCTSRESCDNYTTFITVIPIISYFLLRNSLECLRETYSYVFVWFGKLSLELYICSYHIWLAANSKGILVLLPGYSVLNMLLTTFIFVLVAHELNTCTRLLGVYLAPNSWRVCLRNFVVFLLLLMPIAIKYGYI